MAIPRFVLGFYRSNEHAEEALKEARTNHFRKSAAVSRAEDGTVQLLHAGPASGPRAAICIVLAIFPAVLAGLLGANPRTQVLLGIGAFAIAWLASRRLGFRFRNVVLDHARYLFPGESMVIVLETEQRTTDALAVLKSIGHVSLFVIRPGIRLDQSSRAVGASGEPVAGASLRECAIQLAESHDSYSPGKSQSLLPILRKYEVGIESARADLAEATRLDYGVTHAAEWILDNAYLIRSHIAEIRHNLPVNHAKILPVLAGTNHPWRFRASHVAADLIFKTGHRVTQESILTFLEAYQSRTPLTIAELWVFPLLLRMVLLERLMRLAELTSLRQHQKELADFWANRLLTGVNQGPEQFERILAELDRGTHGLTPHLIARLGEQLHKEESALVPLHKWIEDKMGTHLADIILREHAEEANDVMLIASAIGSLRQLAELQYPKIVVAVSRMEAILCEDPAGIHSRSDFDTRDRCRRIVEEAARQAKTSELEVARQAVDLAKQAAADTREGCVAYYLLDEGLPDLEKRVGRSVPWRQRALRFLYRHPTVLYLGSLTVLIGSITGGFLFAAYTLGVLSPMMLFVLGTMALVPSCELAIQLLQMGLASILPPRVLPKMSFEESGIPEDCRTLVVVPMMLLTPDSIRGEIEKLEVRYLSNPEAGLQYSLLADFTDAEEPEMAEDDKLLGIAVKGIEDLNARHGHGTFILFHRVRTWCETEQRWIGWERKRGKLEELNRLLNGEESTLLTTAGPPSAGIRYVITLDADTQLPHGTARRLIETIAHRLNRVQLTDGFRDRARGYTVIQPRVSITLPSATASRFSRLFTDARGTDPYCRAVSDLYQDVFAEGIYHGKAIYDVQAFHKILTKRFPEQRLLSHDLIEGAYTGVGLATDVELFEQFPYDYTSFSKREHRWIRGDWQIASWVLPRVPGQGAQPAPNPLSAINRWKLLDNLRRSLLAPISLTFLVVSWGFNAAPAAASSLVAMVLTVPLFFQLVRRLAQRWRGDVSALREASSDLNRALVMAAFLPHQSYLSLDAIVRAVYRLRFSRRHLLEWQTAESSHLAARSHLDTFRMQFVLISLLAAVFLLALSLRGFFWHAAYSPFLLLWVGAPAVQSWIGWQRRGVRRLEQIDAADQHYLRRVARETWRYFDDLVGAEHNWLPPDNSQKALRIETAPRTSPTNIGMWLVSAVSATDLGFVTPEQMIERCSSTIDTLETLERCEGHLLNWYHTQTLEPLEPRYVSTADSGNLIASLWVLAQAGRDLETRPQLEENAIRGLADILAVIIERFPPDHTITVPIETLRGLFHEECVGIEVMERILLAAEPARKLNESLRWSISETEERTYWISHLDQQIQQWIQHFDRHLRWAHILLGPPDEFLLPLGEGAILARRELLQHLPSWGELASDELGAILGEGAQRSGLSPKLAAWLTDLKTEYERGCASARELIQRGRRLSERCEALASAMDMRFLYDADRRLFSIGYQVGGPVSATAHYDLLASEARLASLVAIAKDDVPVQHWLALGRPYTSSDGQVLLSWSGTMFEYLMPLLFTRSFRNSLLDNACAAAVKRQIEYGRDRGIPWGISESAYSALDIHKIYQYRAFGVPSLGLKRGLEDDMVVAPYATALALLVFPVDSIRNLQRLQKNGMYGPMGFYESVDFMREQRRQGGKGVIVYTYMAHHQGMTLISINNVLNAGIIQRRFHADRRVRAVEPLLFERIPPQPSMLVHRPTDPVAMRPVSAPSGPAYRVLDEDTPIPRVHLLSNGHYAVMITNSGAGYSRWGGFDITRWRSDSTRDNWGMFLYLREEESNTVWTATHQPLNTKDPSYTAIFTADRAEFRKRKLGVESHLEVTVSPEDDAEIRRLTLVNHGLRTRKIQLSSAVELSLARHSDDRAHPAFHKLFIQTEALPDLQALIAWRRPRSDEDPHVFVAQFIVESLLDNEPFEFETDRARLLGRGRTWQNPRMSLEQTSGYVLDPVFALRRRFVLNPREQRQITLITVAAGSRADLMQLILKYRDAGTCTRAFELAWNHAQLEYRYLGIQGDEALRFGELASHLIYPNSRLRVQVERLRRNVLGQSRLWTYGISGDLPLAVVSVPDSEGLSLVRELLIAHTYWRLHGFKADLVILNREPASYEHPLHEQLFRLVEAHSVHTGTDQPGGVFLRRADLIPEEDLNLILAVAQASLGTVRGLLSKQLSSASEGNPMPPPLQVRVREEQPSSQLPFLQLPYFNGLGGFTVDSREYAIYLPPNTVTPLPWINVMANPVFGALVSESGPGCCWSGNSQSNRLTPWHNDPISGASADAIYIRDEDTGAFWTPTPLPVRELDAYRARHGQGYTEFEHNSHALEQTLVTFVPSHADNADPVRIQQLRIKNRSSRRRRLSVTSYAELVLGSDREVTQMFVLCAWDEKARVFLVTNPYHPEYPHRVAFAAITPQAFSCTSDRAEFLGRNGSLERPAAMRRLSLSNRVGPGIDSCAAMQTKFELDPGEERTVVVLLGQAEDAAEARRLAAHYAVPLNVKQALDQTRQWWDGLLTTIQVKTPVLSVDILMNRWLLYQTLSCRIWGRSALYQSSGAYGFRDQLQDSLAFVYSAPDITRQMILHAASRQFVEGDTQHWWHLPLGSGLRTRCSDDLLWLPYAVCHYVETTGDTGILDAETPFIEGPQLKETELEAYFEPTVSVEQATLFEHCRRAIEKASTHGRHGLPLIGTGDWNDGMNKVGHEGKGESVWLAWFLVDVWRRFADICFRIGQTELAGKYRDHAIRMSTTVEETSWDGDWYRRGYFDDGTPVGSSQNQEAMIDSLPQSWSVICGGANRDHAAQAMRSVDRHLIRRDQKTVLLFTPPFEQSRPHPGYIMGYPPGVRENGGQYTHAALWVAMAFARMKDGRKAVEVLQMLNPIEHTRTPEDCAVYQTEPYAVAADVYSLESRPGRGGWTWYTGSAGWMYRVWLEEVLGFRLRGNRLWIEPAIPEDWPGYSITFRFGQAEYRIEVENGGQASNREIHLEDDRLSHTVHVRLGRPESQGAPHASSCNLGRLSEVTNSEFEA
jgi:cyclic beta-1,2-glucan synthetase